MTEDMFKQMAIYPFVHYTDLSAEYESTTRPYSPCRNLVGFIRAMRVNHGEAEVPSTALVSLNSLVQGNTFRDSEEYNEIVAPLFWDAEALKKSADSILFKMFVQKNFRGLSKIVKVNTSKGYSYYGGLGVILKEERGIIKPLLLYTCTVHNDSSANCLDVVGLNLRVAPSVFLDNDIISKCIVKKLIPVLLNPIDYTQVIHFRPSLALGQTTTMTPKVIVGDLSDWILQPVKPKVDSFDHDLKQLYADERIIDEIIDNL